MNATSYVMYFLRKNSNSDYLRNLVDRQISYYNVITTLFIGAHEDVLKSLFLTGKTFTYCYGISIVDL